MGELMRRYWHPIAAVSELEEKPIKPVRLMGEDLTLFKDLSGQYGLVDRHCPHRRACLLYTSFGGPSTGPQCLLMHQVYDSRGRVILAIVAQRVSLLRMSCVICCWTVDML